MLVLPIMTLELISGALLCIEAPELLIFTNFIMLLMIWLATAVISVPIHNRMARGDSRAETINRLVSTNWLRTILWSLRLGILTYYLLLS